jgi:hypothetical protein
MSILENTLLGKSFKFIGRISTMGETKMVIYVPREYHKEVMKDFKNKPLRVTLEEVL